MSEYQTWVCPNDHHTSQPEEPSDACIHCGIDDWCLDE